MFRTSHARILGVCLAAAAFLAAGCGAGNPQIKGRIASRGQPYKLGEGERVQLTFNGTGDLRIAAAAAVAPDGTFTVTGAENQGLPPGAYAISVTSMSFGPNAPPDQLYKDKFGGAFGVNSPLRYEVGKEPVQSIVVDVGSKTVAKE